MLKSAVFYVYHLKKKAFSQRPKEPISALAITALVFLQSDGEHGFKTGPWAWVQVVVAVNQVVGGVWLLVVVVVAVLAQLLIAVVQH